MFFRQFIMFHKQKDRNQAAKPEFL